MAMASAVGQCIPEYKTVQTLHKLWDSLPTYSVFFAEPYQGAQGLLGAAVPALASLLASRQQLLCVGFVMKGWRDILICRDCWIYGVVAPFCQDEGWQETMSHRHTVNLVEADARLYMCDA